MSATAQEIRTVCEIPVAFKGDVTLGELIAERYLPVRGGLTHADLVACLEESPELVEAWDLMMASKQTSGGWSFGEAADGGYSVEMPSPDESASYIGLAAPPPEWRQVLRRGSMADACAVYIVSELDFWAAVEQERPRGGDS